MVTEYIDEIRTEIRNFILSSINIPNLDNDDNLFESGIVNSLFAIQLMTHLEKSFKIEVTIDDLSLDNFQSVNSTSAFVLNKIELSKAEAG